MPALNDLTNQRFGRLVVLRRAPNTHTNQTRWYCHCDCDNLSVVYASTLRSGGTTSCGCFHREMVGNLFRTHGYTSRNGQSERPAEYRTWEAMRRRCYNKCDPAYRNYGERGISICERWLDFAAFLADMGKKPSPQHSIERIDNNRGYEPGNCVWATPGEQARNRRVNHYITINGRTQAMIAWAEEYGVPYGRLWDRINKGWLPERALVTPRGGKR